MVAAVRAEARASLPDTGFAVHPDNVAAVRLLLAVATQWQTVALSTLGRAEIRRTGLIYASIEPAARMIGLELTPEVFAQLRWAEAEALAAWREAAEARR